MSTINKITGVKTHEGGRAQRISPELELERTVMSCLLWEKNFYESGVSVVGRICGLCSKLSSSFIVKTAIKAREEMLIRHVPLLLMRECCRKTTRDNALIAEGLSRIVTRPDDLTEFLCLYWQNGKVPLCSGVKKGLSRAFVKFDAYQLAKYDRKKAVKLKDVMFMTHPKPKDSAQEAIWKQFVGGKLESPDTWEVALSSGGDKKETWTRLITEKRLGDLALLRNLRNMQQENVDIGLIRGNLLDRQYKKILPFQFIAASISAPDFEPELEACMMGALLSPFITNTLAGETVLVVDVSYSMEDTLSKGSMTRLDAACGLAIILREMCSSIRIYTFSNQVAKLPPRKGFALRDCIINSQQHRGTCLKEAINAISARELSTAKRLIVITDEQSNDGNGTGFAQMNYMINVACCKNGLSYGNNWTHIDGWSAKIVDYIKKHEEKLAPTIKHIGEQNDR